MQPLHITYGKTFEKGGAPKWGHNPYEVELKIFFATLTV